MYEEDKKTEWYATLRHEFDAEEGEEHDCSFLLQLHCGSGWDWVAFERLFFAMRVCCKAYENREHLERWIAEGFWYLSWFPRAQIERGFPNNTGRYENALINLEHLAFWLFTGDTREDTQFEPMENIPLKPSLFENRDTF
jgi:hypothetical protein